MDATRWELTLMIKRTQVLVLALTFCFVATAAWADFKLERKLGSSRAGGSSWRPTSGPCP